MLVLRSVSYKTKDPYNKNPGLFVLGKGWKTDFSPFSNDGSKKPKKIQGFDGFGVLGYDRYTRVSCMPGGCLGFLNHQQYQELRETG